jgi:hypothetical protein
VQVSVGDQIRVTKNFKGFRNNELLHVTGIEPRSIQTDKGAIDTSKPVHLDQGICVTSHAAQGKTVDQVLVSVPVSAFSQVNEAQLYVSMSRARHSMRLFTDSRAALREAVTKTSERVSALSLLSQAVTKAMDLDHARWKAFHQAQRVDMARAMER